MGELVRTSCRACDSSNLFIGIDLWLQPLAGGFLESSDEEFTLYENKMLICSDCGLGQLSVDVDPSELYRKYNWRTSTSQSYLDYIWDFADEHIVPTVTDSDWVLEIASNDGYLLEHLQNKGIDVLGVDPAKNISMYAIAKGIPVITEFFNAELAKKIVELKGHPKWIVANNVAAHTPDLQSFMEGISILCDEDTIVTIENPTIMNILKKQHFDVIFHEHYSYLSANAMQKLAERYGMYLFAVDGTPPQGGSNRYWLAKGEPYAALYETERERKHGLFSQEAWSKVQTELEQEISTFHKAIEELNNNGAVICGMGASAKSTVTLNFARVQPGEIKAIADDVKEKQGFYVPGATIPILSTKEMLELSPTDIVIFAWNIKDELEAKLRNLGYTGRVWTWKAPPSTH